MEISHCFVLNSFSSGFFFTAEVPDSPIPVKLEMPRFTSPAYLDPTIYPTEVGVSSVGGRETDIQMLSTAIKITLDLERNVKVCVSFTSFECTQNTYLRPHS